MRNYIYQLPTIGTSQNIQLIYNFDNISINIPEPSTTVSSTNILSNIRALFPSFKITYKLTPIYNSFAINTQPNNQQVSYSDNITPSPIQYTIKYLHVGISPIEFKPLVITNNNTFAIILDCIDSTGNILLIIIPLIYSKDLNYEDPQITSLLTNTYITSTQAAVDINQIIPSSIFNTFSSGNNRVILFNDSSFAYKTITFMNTIITKKIERMIQTSLPTANSSLSIPQKKTILAQNDIYIDCYKVGESNNIDNGVINIDPQTTKKSRSLYKRNSIIFYVLGALVGVFILCYAFIYIGRTIMPKPPTTETNTTAPKIKNWFGF